MAWTNVGFDGTINEAQWASLAGLLGNGYVAAGNGDCLATAVPGARSVSVAAGSIYGDGILSTNSAPETVAMTTPVNGQWYVIALRRTWATNTAALVAIAGATTTTTTPTAPPTSFPTLNTNVGVLTDQPIAWAWCNSANTTVVVYDIRLKAVKSLPPVVATSAERDAKFMSPYQGLQVWRDDLGAVETYFGLYNASTNPGGRDTAGWYTTTRQSGLVPMKPTSVSIAGGTATVNDIGTITFGTGTTAITLNGIFTSEFKNYRIVIDTYKSGTTGNDAINARFTTGGTAASGTNYMSGAAAFSTNAAALQNLGGDTVTSFYVNRIYDNATYQSAVIDVCRPAESVWTTYTGNAIGRTTGSNQFILLGGIHQQSISYDGIYFYATANSISGTINVYGYND